MPIRPNEKQELIAYCDFCGDEAHKADPAWMRHYGFDIGKPKINIMCKKCNVGSLRGGVLIKGYGVVEQEKVQEVAEQEQQNKVNARRTKTTVEQLRSQLNWSGIEAAIKAKTFKVNNMAVELNANPLELRDLIVERFGAQVEFKRGRNGGVFWVEGKPNV